MKCWEKRTWYVNSIKNSTTSIILIYSLPQDIYAADLDDF